MPKILIVEDDPDLSLVAKKRLTVRGFEVATAADAYQGVQMAHRERPDLVILDLMLPAGGGLTFLKNLRVSEPLRATPILVLSASRDQAYRQQVLAAGVDGWMDKPYEIDDLEAKIRELLAGGE